MTKQTQEKMRLTTPVGRLINNSLREKDIFVDEDGHEGKPSYKIEMVFDKDDAALEVFENKLAEAAVEEWGAGAEDEYWDGDIRSPIQDGDERAEKRKADGKSGDAYEGKWALRAHTLFNRDGEDSAGGVYVCDENAEELDFAEGRKVYNGSFGAASVTVQTYLINGKRGITLYLNGYQFVKDGDRLRGSDPSSLFSPMMGEKSAEGKGRKRRS